MSLFDWLKLTANDQFDFDKGSDEYHCETPEQLTELLGRENWSQVRLENGQVRKIVVGCFKCNDGVLEKNHECIEKKIVFRFRFKSDEHLIETSHLKKYDILNPSGGSCSAKLYVLIDH